MESKEINRTYPEGANLDSENQTENSVNLSEQPLDNLTNTESSIEASEEEIAVSSPEASQEIIEEPVIDESAIAETSEPVSEDAGEEKTSSSEEKTGDEPSALHDVNYTELSREELIAKFKELLRYPLQDAKDHLETVKEFFDKATAKIEEEARRSFIESGEPEENFSPPADSLQKEFSALMYEYKTKRDEARTSLEEEKEKNLLAKHEVIERIKDLVNRQESLNNTFQEFRDLQQRWREIGPVPQAKLHGLWETFHLHVENFYSYIKINNELRDLDLKKNYEAKLILCEKAEKLMLESSIMSAFKALQKYHDQWREIGPVPRDKKEDVWERFKGATIAINQRQQEHFEALKEQLKKNLDIKVELCEKAESLSQEDTESPKEWEQKSKQLIELQQIWKTVGFAPKKENNKVYDRFRKACDAFFNKKRDYFKTYKDDQSSNYQLKMELCIQAEAMKDSTEWRKTTDEFIRIQKKWKEIGPVPRKQSEIIWKQFRDACDYFFDKKSHFFSNIDKSQDDNLKLKKDIIEELKNFVITEDSEACFNALQEFQRRWSEIGFVPIKEKERINNEFRSLINKQFDKLNVDEGNKGVQKFRNRLENWKASNQFNEKIGRERNGLILKLRQLENDIILWENNIGFFAKSKSSDALIREFNNKIESGKRNIKLLNEKLQLIESML